MIEELKKYVSENNLQNRAIDGFWINFNNWKHLNPMDYAEKFSNITPEDLDVFVHSIGLRSSEWPICNYNHVTINVLIHHEDRYMGRYIFFSSLDSDVDDDDLFEM